MLLLLLLLIQKPRCQIFVVFQGSGTLRSITPHPPAARLLLQPPPMIWPCRLSRRIDFSFAPRAKADLDSTPHEANSLSRGHFSLHFTRLLLLTPSPRPFLPPPPPPPAPHRVSSERAEIERAWLMQHPSPGERLRCSTASRLDAVWEIVLHAPSNAAGAEISQQPIDSKNKKKIKIDSFTASRRAD